MAVEKRRPECKLAPQNNNAQQNKNVHNRTTTLRADAFSDTSAGSSSVSNLHLSAKNDLNGPVMFSHTDMLQLHTPKQVIP